MNLGRLVTFLALGACSLLWGGKLPADSTEKAKEILKATGTAGGLVVHLGSGDGKLAAAIGKSGNYVVQGLAAEGEKVREARDYVSGLGLYGRVCFDRLGDSLPYIDNLVNLLVVEDHGAIGEEEMLRVLAPEGKLYMLAGGEMETKPRMKGVDDWTHFMHDSTGNGVAEDVVVSPPKYLKWVGGSTWSRSHGHMGNMPGLVAAKGRLFSILDEGFIGKDQVHAPAAWSQNARDAYNGILLWRRPIRAFHDASWGKKSGPIQLPERLVTDGERVYATLEIEGSVSAMDAVTGDLIREYEGTIGTEEILHNNGVLFLLRNPLRETGVHREPIRADKSGFGGGSPHGENAKEIVAVNAGTGTILWKKGSVVLATTLAVDGRQVYFHDGKRIVCLDRGDGSEKWCTPPVERMKPVMAQATPELLVHKEVVLFVGGLRFGDQGQAGNAMKRLKKSGDKEDFKKAKAELKRGVGKKSEFLHAFDADSGKLLWDALLEGGVYGSTKYSVFAIGEVVWTGDVGGGGPMGKRGLNPYTGRELRTGKVVKEFTRDVYHVSYHSRCYPNKATVKYLMPNIRGVEMVDFEKETWSADNWIRPGCSFGLVPSHGMIYTPPHACTCYAQSKLTGMNAVYGDGMGATKALAVPGKVRLETGTMTPLTKTEPGDLEWPTYRGNNARTGSSPTPIGADLSVSWTSGLGGRLSALTIAEGRLFVVQIERHKVHALSADDGEKLWSFTAGGRVDSPPTLYGGRAYFGCADGYLYCLNASDGSLAWRFLAAADDRRLISYEQIESVHPVHGSVLIHDGVVYCLAGRSMFLDGGLRLYRLDADTGRELSVNVMNEINPFTGRPLQEKTVKQSMPASMPDLLSSDGTFIFMGVQALDLEGKRIEVETHCGELDLKSIHANHQGMGRHIFSPQGFLDEARFHRSRWIYGKVYFGGHQDEWRAERAAPVGNMLVCGDENVFGYHGNIAAGAKSLKDTLFSVRKDAAPSWDQGILGHDWIIKAPLYFNAMNLADQTLFLAGSTEHDKEIFLLACAASDGKKLAECRLPAMAVWDGMAAANGRLHIALKNGSIVCMKAKPRPGGEGGR